MKAISLLAAGVLLSACGDAPVRVVAAPSTPPRSSTLLGPPDVITAYETRSPGLDPLRDVDVVDRRWQDLVFDRLYYAAADGAPKSRVVERDEVVGDALVVTLAAGVKFSDGSELDAADVCATLEYLAAVGRLAPSCEVLDLRVARLGTTQRNTLDIALLPAGLSETELAADAAFWLVPVGSGPMRGRVGRREVLLERRFDAHRTVGVRTVHVALGGSADMVIRTLDAGAADLAFDVTPGAASQNVDELRPPGGGVVAARSDMLVPDKLPIDRLFIEAEELRRR